MAKQKAALEMLTCATCGKRINGATRHWSILDGKDYCGEHYPAQKLPGAVS